MADALEREISGSHLIEGIRLDSLQLRSSIARALDLDSPEWNRSEQTRKTREDKVVRATLQFLEHKGPLTPETIKDVHTQLDGDPAWAGFRTKPVSVFDVASHNSVYDAPPFEEVPLLVNRFCEWYNADRLALDAPIGAALAHYFWLFRKMRTWVLRRV